MTDKCRNEPEKQIVLESGRKCTVSGEWEIQGIISTSCFVTKGEIMPLYCNKPVKWMLITKG